MIASVSTDHEPLFHEEGKASGRPIVGTRHTVTGPTEPRNEAGGHDNGTDGGGACHSPMGNTQGKLDCLVQYGTFEKSRVHKIAGNQRLA